MTDQNNVLRSKQIKLQILELAAIELTLMDDHFKINELTSPATGRIYLHDHCPGAVKAFKGLALLEARKERDLLRQELAMINSQTSR